MKYLIPESDDRTVLTDGFGPFTYESNKLIEDAARAWQADQKPTKFKIEPVRPKLDFKPNFFEMQLPLVFFVSKELLTEKMPPEVRSCIIATVTVGEYGEFFMIDLDSVESSFIELVDFATSEFAIVNGFSMWRENGPVIIDRFSGKDSIRKWKNRRTALDLLDVFSAERISIHSEWCFPFFVFDEQLYVQEAWDLADSGLTPSKNECELVVTGGSD